MYKAPDRALADMRRVKAAVLLGLFLAGCAPRQLHVRTQLSRQPPTTVQANTSGRDSAPWKPACSPSMASLIRGPAQLPGVRAIPLPFFPLLCDFRLFHFLFALGPSSSI